MGKRKDPWKYKKCKKSKKRMSGMLCTCISIRNSSCANDSTPAEENTLHEKQCTVDIIEQSIFESVFEIEPDNNILPPTSANNSELNVTNTMKIKQEPIDFEEEKENSINQNRRKLLKNISTDTVNYELPPTSANNSELNITNSGKIKQEPIDFEEGKENNINQNRRKLLQKNTSTDTVNYELPPTNANNSELNVTNTVKIKQEPLDFEEEKENSINQNQRKLLKKNISTDTVNYENMHIKQEPLSQDLTEEVQLKTAQRSSESLIPEDRVEECSVSKNMPIFNIDCDFQSQSKDNYLDISKDIATDTLNCEVVHIKQEPLSQDLSKEARPQAAQPSSESLIKEEEVQERPASKNIPLVCIDCDEDDYVRMLNKNTSTNTLNCENVRIKHEPLNQDLSKEAQSKVQNQKILNHTEVSGPQSSKVQTQQDSEPFIAKDEIQEYVVSKPIVYINIADDDNLDMSSEKDKKNTSTDTVNYQDVCIKQEPLIEVISKRVQTKEVEGKVQQNLKNFVTNDQVKQIPVSKNNSTDAINYQSVYIKQETVSQDLSNEAETEEAKREVQQNSKDQVNECSGSNCSSSSLYSGIRENISTDVTNYENVYIKQEPLSEDLPKETQTKSLDEKLLEGTERQVLQSSKVQVEENPVSSICSSTLGSIALENISANVIKYQNMCIKQEPLSEDMCNQDESKETEREVQHCSKSLITRDQVIESPVSNICSSSTSDSGIGESISTDAINYQNVHIKQELLSEDLSEEIQTKKNERQVLKSSKTIITNDQVKESPLSASNICSSSTCTCVAENISTGNINHQNVYIKQEPLSEDLLKNAQMKFSIEEDQVKPVNKDNICSTSILGSDVEKSEPLNESMLKEAQAEMKEDKVIIGDLQEEERDKNVSDASMETNHVAIERGDNLIEFGNSQALHQNLKTFDADDYRQEELGKEKNLLFELHNTEGCKQQLQRLCSYINMDSEIKSSLCDDNHKSMAHLYNASTAIEDEQLKEYNKLNKADDYNSLYKNISDASMETNHVAIERDDNLTEFGNSQALLQNIKAYDADDYRQEELGKENNLLFELHNTEGCKQQLQRLCSYINVDNEMKSSLCDDNHKSGAHLCNASTAIEDEQLKECNKLNKANDSNSLYKNVSDASMETNHVAIERGGNLTEFGDSQALHQNIKAHDADDYRQEELGKENNLLFELHNTEGCKQQLQRLCSYINVDSEMKSSLCDDNHKSGAQLCNASTAIEGEQLKECNKLNKANDSNSLDYINNISTFCSLFSKSSFKDFLNKSVAQNSNHMDIGEKEVLDFASVRTDNFEKQENLSKIIESFHDNTYQETCLFKMGNEGNQTSYCNNHHIKISETPNNINASEICFSNSLHDASNTCTNLKYPYSFHQEPSYDFSSLEKYPPLNFDLNPSEILEAVEILKSTDYLTMKKLFLKSNISEGSPKVKEISPEDPKIAHHRRVNFIFEKKVKAEAKIHNIHNPVRTEFSNIHPNPCMSTSTLCRTSSQPRVEHMYNSSKEIPLDDAYFSFDDLGYKKSEKREACIDDDKEHSSKKRRHGTKEQNVLKKKEYENTSGHFSTLSTNVKCVTKSDAKADDKVSEVYSSENIHGIIQNREILKIDESVVNDREMSSERIQINHEGLTPEKEDGNSMQKLLRSIMSEEPSESQQTTQNISSISKAYPSYQCEQSSFRDLFKAHGTNTSSLKMSNSNYIQKSSIPNNTMSQSQVEYNVEHHGKRKAVCVTSEKQKKSKVEALPSHSFHEKSVNKVEKYNIPPKVPLSTPSNFLGTCKTRTELVKLDSLALSSTQSNILASISNITGLSLFPTISNFCNNDNKIKTNSEFEVNRNLNNIELQYTKCTIAESELQVPCSPVNQDNQTVTNNVLPPEWPVYDAKKFCELLINSDFCSWDNVLHPGSSDINISEMQDMQMEAFVHNSEFPAKNISVNESQCIQIRKDNNCVLGDLKYFITSSNFRMYELYFIIITWNVESFLEYDKNKRTPPIVNKCRHVEDVYDSYESYYETYFPLLLLENWQKIYISWKNLNVKEKQGYIFKICSLEKKAHFISMTCDTVIKNADLETSPKEGYIILVEFIASHKAGKKVLGYVHNVLRREYSSGHDKNHPSVQHYKYSESDKLAKRKVSFYIAYDVCHHMKKGDLLRISVLINFTYVLTQNEALLDMQKSLLCSTILNPQSCDVKKVELPARRVANDLTVYVGDLIRSLNLCQFYLSLVKTSPLCDSILAVVTMVDHIKKLSSKVLVCTKTENAFIKIAHNLSHCNLVILGKEVKDESLKKYTLDAFVHRSKGDNNFIQKRNILSTRDVFLTMLSTCCFSEMKMLLKDLNVMYCIIDEAHACTEPECLIPLLCGIPKIILMGNPDETLKLQSKTAAGYGYNKSLFHRVWVDPEMCNNIKG